MYPNTFQINKATSAQKKKRASNWNSHILHRARLLTCKNNILRLTEAAPIFMFLVPDLHHQLVQNPPKQLPPSQHGKCGKL